MRSLRDIDLVWYTGFNEAEARTPRMRPIMAMATTVQIVRFNEAEARTPRMRARAVAEFQLARMIQ